MCRFPTARDPVHSLLQSAALAVARARDDADGGLRAAVDGLLPARRGPVAPYAPPGGRPRPDDDCAALGLAFLRAHLAGDPVAGTAATDRLRYSECDPLWLETLADYAARFLPDGTAPPIPYRPWRTLADFVVTAPSARLRIGLLSDWGTGTAHAAAVARALARHRPEVVIHLGDIYYAGTPAECDAHFLRPLRAAMPDARLFTLCGNHDVYSGGVGYYGLLDRIGQGASYFALRSPDRSWQLLGLDTGLHDRDPFTVTANLTFIEQRELAWHADKVRGFPGRTALLSHHQPFSAFAQIGPLASHDPVNPHLLAAHATLAAAGRIDAWFWGHEHSLRLYAPFRGVRAGRNIGFGAIPVAATPASSEPLSDLVDPPSVGTATPLDIVDGAWAHGFALLDLAPEGIDASYWQLTRPDTPVATERLGTGPSPSVA